MGGIGSGRRRTTNNGVLEDAPLLDIRQIRRLGLAKLGECRVDTLRWSQRGLTVAEARVRVDLISDDAGSIAVAMLGHPKQIIRIEGRPCRYGGHRLYFVCPIDGRHCEVLCLRDGRFASRQAHRLTYATQSMDDLGRVRKRRCELRARLDGQGLRPRPRGRHRYNLAERHHRAVLEERSLFAQAVERLSPRKSRSETQSVPDRKGRPI